eukprot:TRINITY_DN6034_c0_g1_i1.p1 TRINITY_DN6034_c0_g1~~TRINITY_DN6034_c0_g1_i1.p1  ORF type:complete len:691 (-),score=141.74 TRINITY_DN6034_c0_g1_i1:397-2358(-)
MQVDKWFKLKSTSSSSSSAGELRLGLQYTSLKRQRREDNEAKPIASQNNLDKLKLLANLPRGPPTIYEMIEHNIMEEYAFLQAELDRLEEKHGRESNESKAVRTLLDLLHQKSDEFSLLPMNQIAQNQSEISPQLQRLVESLSSKISTVRDKAVTTLLEEHFRNDDGSESRDFANAKGITPLVSLLSIPTLSPSVLEILSIITTYVTNSEEMEKALFVIADQIPNMAQQADFDFAGIAISNIYGNTIKAQEAACIQGSTGIVAHDFMTLLAQGSDNTKLHVLWALSQTAINMDKLHQDYKPYVVDFLVAMAPYISPCLSSESGRQMQELAASALCTFFSTDSSVAESEAVQQLVPYLLALLHSKYDSTIIHALKAIANFAIEATTRETYFNTEEPLSAIVALLSHTNPEIQLYAAWAVSNIADIQYQEITHLLQSYGAIPALLKLLVNPKDDIKIKALWALTNLIHNDKAALMAAGSFDVLSNLLANGKAFVRIEVLRLLAVVATTEAGRLAIIEGTILSSILQQLSSADTRNHNVKDQALWTICRLAANEKARDMIRDAKGFHSFISLLNNSFAQVHEPLLRLLLTLTMTNEKNKQEFCEIGGIPPLVLLFTKSDGQCRKLCKSILASLSRSDKYRKIIAEFMVLNLRIVRK